jgi:hypothetical protein
MSTVVARRNREWKATDPVKSEVKCVIYGKDKSDTDKAVKSLEKGIFTDYQDIFKTVSFGCQIDIICYSAIRQGI